MTCSPTLVTSRSTGASSSTDRWNEARAWERTPVVTGDRITSYEVISGPARLARIDLAVLN
jgi:hypothetical protein